MTAARDHGARGLRSASVRLLSILARPLPVNGGLAPTCSLRTDTNTAGMLSRVLLAVNMWPPTESSGECAGPNVARQIRVRPPQTSSSQRLNADSRGALLAGGRRRPTCYPGGRKVAHRVS